MLIGKHVAGLGVTVGLLMLLSGCGLDVMVMPDPTNPQEGQTVDFTAMVKNKTGCEVTNGVLYVATFFQSDILPANVNFCDLITQIDGRDINGLQSALGRVFSPAAVGTLMQEAQDRAFGTSPVGSGQTVPQQCEPIEMMDTAQGIDPGDFFELQCEFNTLDPFEKETLTFALEAPQSGPIRTIAIAIGDIPSDEECRPGSPELGFVAGCFDSARAPETAPALSFGGLAAAAAALAGVGIVALRRRR